MSRSRHTGHGRCGVCGDAGAARRKREAIAARLDERELGPVDEAVMRDDMLDTYASDDYEHALASGRLAA